MARKKQIPLTETIKQFLIQSSVKAGTEAVRLPGELELCEKFGVARGTVRLAIEESIRLGYTTRLPKRRGLFSFPHPKALDKPMLIAVLDGDLQSSILNRASSSILSGFFEEMYSDACNFTIPRMNDLSCDSICKLNVDGLVWLFPPFASSPVIRQLIAADFPVVAVPFLYSEHFDLDPGHYTYVDYLPAAKKRAEIFHRNGCRRLLICGGSPLSVRLLEQEFRVVPDAETVVNLKYGDPALETTLRKMRIDSVFAFGGPKIYKEIVQTIHRLPDPDSILIQFDPGANEAYFKEQNPDLRIVIGDFIRDFQKRDREVGKNAALKLKKLLKYKKQETET